MEIMSKRSIRKKRHWTPRPDFSKRGFMDELADALARGEIKTEEDLYNLSRQYYSKREQGEE